MKMISESRIRKDGKKIEAIGDRYIADKGAFMGLIVDEAGNNILSYGGDVKHLISGIALTLAKVATSTDAVNENVFQYVAKEADKLYREAKGLPPKRSHHKKAEVVVEEVKEE